LQLIFCIETEEIGRALRAIGARHFLGRIDHVGKGEACRAANVFMLSKESSG
jgi:non-ribosomal peptide synthetase component F